MICLILEAIIVVLSSWFLTKRYFGDKPCGSSVLTCFLLFFAQIVLVELFLGISGRLYFGNVFLLHSVIFIFAYFSCAYKKDAGFAKPAIGFVLDSNLLILAFSVFFSFFLVKTYVNLITPTQSPGSMQGHLAFPATWIINGNLENPFQIFGSIPILNPAGFETSSFSYYPINAQLFYTWLMLPLRNAFLADAGQAPFYIIGIIAVYSILRKYDVNRKMALLTGFLWALIPNLFKQLKIGSEIDVICAVLFLLVFETLLLLRSKFTFRYAVLFGIATGLLVGTKIINLVWLAAFMPLVCFVIYKGIRNSRLSFGRALCFLGAIIFPVILLGGYVFIKNYMLLGNPLFPVNLKIFGRTVFAGILGSADYKMQVAPWGFDLAKIIFKEGLGMQFLGLILPGTFIPLVFCRIIKKDIKDFGGYILLFATPLTMLVLYALSINIYTVRYVFPYLSMGLLTAVIFLARMKWGSRYLTVAGFISIVYASFELANGYELVVSILLSLACFVLLAFYKKQVAGFYEGRKFKWFIICCFLGLSFALVFLNAEYDREEFNRYPASFSKKERWQVPIGLAWKALDELTGSGSYVAYTGRQEFYPFYGRGLKNRVKYVSINKKQITPYNHPDGLYRREKSYPAWRENLQKEKTEYLFVAQPFFNNRESEDPAKFPIEDEWAAANPQEFKLVFSNSMAHIYKVSIK
ncbi:MAG: hypothetical protein PHT50_00290 [Candidatus Omnitrophica bacterium]|nr:hypothetical protein [Candidatus Omnitrophota bacterium]